MAKRKLTDLEAGEFDDVSSARPSPNASLHGMLANLSPMKKGKQVPFFEGKLTDGTKHIRIVGFQPDHQKRLASFYEKGDSVALRNCELKPGRQSDELEIIMKTHSHVEVSPKKFCIKDLSAIGSNNIMLDSLEDKCNFDKVTFSAKAIRVDDPIHIAAGKTKQDVIVADASSTARVTLWESDIGKLTQDESYKFTNLVVRTYNREKYLSLPREGASIQKIEDIGDVDENETEDTATTVYGAQVLSASLDKYCVCLSCKKKVMPTTEHLGRCTSCSALQRLDKCTTQMSAKLVLSSGTDYLTLLCFGSNLSDIVQEKAITEANLIEAPPFTLTYDINVITRVRRSTYSES